MNVDYISFTQPIGKSLRSLKKRKHVEDPSSKGKWSLRNIEWLKTEVRERNISEYPTYLKFPDAASRVLWSEFSLCKENVFSAKQLREKYIEELSPKINHTKISSSEFARIDEFFRTSKSSTKSWTKLSRILFEENNPANDLYRAPRQLKNAYYARARTNFLKNSSTSTEVIDLSTPLPKSTYDEISIDFLDELDFDDIAFWPPLF